MKQKGFKQKMTKQEQKERSDPGHATKGKNPKQINQPTQTNITTTPELLMENRNNSKTS